MDLNHVWEIHWRLTGQTHMYGWVDIQGIHCRVTMARVKQGGRVEVGFGHDPAPGTYTLTPAGRLYGASDRVGPVPWRPHGS